MIRVTDVFLKNSVISCLAASVLPSFTYPIVLTRDLDKARKWLMRTHAGQSAQVCWCQKRLRDINPCPFM